MSKNFVVVLKASISIKGQSHPEGTELGAVSVDAKEGFDTKNIVNLIEQGVVDLVDPSANKKTRKMKALKPIKEDDK